MNAHLRRTFYLFAAGFFGLVAMLAYWQVYSREALANNPENGFQTQRSISSPRGLILAGDGETVLAKSVKRETPQGPVYDRVYPLGAPFSNVVGYWSTRYGATGIEIANNTDLSSIAGEPQTLDDLINRATGGPQPGNNVVLTLDPGLQELAYQELQGSTTGRGSVVALDPKTGEILAMASSPSFDPNDIDDNYPELAQRHRRPTYQPRDPEPVSAWLGLQGDNGRGGAGGRGEPGADTSSTAGPTSCRATPSTTSRARTTGR